MRMKNSTTILKKTSWRKLQICVPATKLQQFKQLNIHTKSILFERNRRKSQWLRTRKVFLNCEINNSSGETVWQLQGFAAFLEDLRFVLSTFFRGLNLLLTSMVTLRMVTHMARVNVYHSYSYTCIKTKTKNIKMKTWSSFTIGQLPRL